MMNEEIVEAEISGGINEFDMQIWQLQSEVKRKKREQRAAAPKAPSPSEA